MPARIEMKGTAEFRETAAKLKAAGNGQLSRKMAREMRSAARPAVNDARQSVRSLSSSADGRGGGSQARAQHTASRSRSKSERGRDKAFAGRGLRETVARAVRVQVSAAARSASMRIRVQTRHLPPDQRTLPRRMNEGRWRHPVFGNRAAWVTQVVNPKGWFDRPMRKHGRKVRDEAVSVVDDINRTIAQ